MYPIDIVLVTWHREDITRKFIQALQNNTKREHYRLIVIDNGSPLEMAGWLLELYSKGEIDWLQLNPTNLGLEPARNQGLEKVTSRYFICADNDCLPMPIDEDGVDWVEKLTKLIVENSEYAAISARTQVMIGSGNIFEDVTPDQQLVDFPHPGGSLRIMDTQAVRDVGGWRDDVSGRGAEERYICGKLQEVGFKTAFAVNVNCLHLFGDRTHPTDRWGYPRNWKPEDTGHSDISHPALTNGDDPEEVKRYLGGKDARRNS